jgi:hypothetical protein
VYDYESAETGAPLSIRTNDLSDANATSHKEDECGQAQEMQSAESSQRRAGPLPPWLTPSVKPGDWLGIADKSSDETHSTAFESAMYAEIMGLDDSAQRRRDAEHLYYSEKPDSRDMDDLKTASRHSMFGIDPEGASPGPGSITPAQKEERVRMLEAAFAASPEGGVAVARPTSSSGMSPSAVVFRSDGRRVRIAMRCGQALLAWGAAFCCVYVALVCPHSASLIPKFYLPNLHVVFG